MFDFSQNFDFNAVVVKMVRCFNGLFYCLLFRVKDTSKSYQSRTKVEPKSIAMNRIWYDFDGCFIGDRYKHRCYILIGFYCSISVVDIKGSSKN